jgi:hypothetical protein
MDPQNFGPDPDPAKFFLFFHFFGVLLLILIRNLIQMRTWYPLPKSNVMDPQNFGPDPDPANFFLFFHFFGVLLLIRIGIRFQIRIRNRIRIHGNRIRIRIWIRIQIPNPDPGGKKTSDNTNPDSQHSKKRCKSWDIFFLLLTSPYFLLHSSLKITWIHVSVAVSTLGRRIHVDHHLLLGPLPAPPASNSRGGRAGLLLLLLATLTRGVAVPVVRISVAVIKEVVILLLQLLLDVDQGQIGPLPVKKSMLFHYPVHFTRSETCNDERPVQYARSEMAVKYLLRMVL